MLRKVIYLVFIVGCFAFLPHSVFSQWSVQFSGSIGYTAVDLEEWAGREPIDWNETLSGFNFRGSYGISEKLSVGLEYGYNYLFWYQLRLPFGEQTIMRIRDVDADYIMAVGNYVVSDNFFLEAGLGNYFFESFSSFTLMTAVGYDIALGKSFSIPVSLRSDFTSDLTAIALNAGLKYRFNH